MPRGNSELSHPFRAILILDPILQRLLNQNLPILIPPQRKVLYLVPARLLELLEQPEMLHHPARIGRDVDPRANGEDFGGTLDDRNVYSLICFPTRNRTREAADSSAHDRDMEGVVPARGLVLFGNECLRVRGMDKWILAVVWAAIGILTLGSRIIPST
jgi:hypothetical protein